MRRSPVFAALLATSSWLVAQTASAQSSSPNANDPPLAISSDTTDSSGTSDSLPAIAVTTADPPAVHPFTTPQRPPLVLEPMFVSAVRYPLLRDDPETNRATLSAVEQEAIITRTRGVRVAIGNLAAFGGLVIGSGLTAIGVAGPLILCGLSCGSGGSAFIAGIGATLGIGTTFLAPAAFVYGASRLGVRGSYWATFGGFWLGLLGSGLFSGLSGFSGNAGVIQVTSAIALFFPFVGMSIGHELTATASREGDERPRNASILQGFPLIAVTPTSASLGWTAQF
jgi:hypothetical protein